MGHHDGHLQANAVGGQHLVPVGDELLVGQAHGPDVAVQVVEAQRVHAVVGFAQGGVPVHLVGEGVPGEAHDGHAVVAHAQHVGPLFPEPMHGFVAVGALPKVGFGVHHGQAVALVVLVGNGVVAKYFARGPGAAIGGYAVLVALVIVIAHDAVPLQVVAQKEVVLLAAHAMVHQVLVHLRIDAPAVVQIQRQKPPRIHDFGGLNRGRVFGVGILRRLALNENGIGPDFQNGFHGQHVGFHNVLERRHEAPVAAQLLVPPPEKPRKLRADEHLVHRRVELHPRKPLRKRPGVLRKQHRKIGVLEVANPVGHPKMAQVDDGGNVAPQQVLKRDIGKGPVVLMRPQKRGVNGRPVAQKPDAQLIHQIKVPLPKLVVVAFRQLIHAQGAVLDGGVAVFDAGGKKELGAHGRKKVRLQMRRQVKRAAAKASRSLPASLLHSPLWRCAVARARTICTTG